MQTVRIWFEKVGMAKYISHLDLTRCMARAMRRAHVPAWYTEGFNPHLFMTFAMPLSLGQEGIHESMDIKLPEGYDLSRIPAQMNLTMPQGLRILSATEPQMKPTAIAFARYAVTFTPEQGTASELRRAMEAVLLLPTLCTVKKTKQGEREIDLKAEIKALSLTEEENTVRMSLLLPAGNVGNINPSLLTDLLAEKLEIPFAVRFVREEAFDADGGIFA